MLNKRSNYNRNENNRRNPYNILPSPRILEEYDKLYPGSAKELFNMAKEEQKHRHQWQSKYLTYHNTSHRFGQFFAIIYNILILSLVTRLFIIGQSEMAVRIFSVNALLITIAILITYIERRVVTRRPPRRNIPDKDKLYP